MLHLRYDWRRPLFWAAICMVFFLSSQGSSTKKNEDRANVAVNVETDEWANR